MILSIANVEAELVWRWCC